MKKILVLALLLGFTGIANAGIFYTDVTQPVSGNCFTGCEKCGISKEKSVLGLVSIGDAGIKAACQDGDIKQIHYVEQHIKSVFIFFRDITTKVYGN